MNAPSLAAVIAEHRWHRGIDGPYLVRCSATGCDWVGDLRNSGKTSVGLVAGHVEQVWRERCTIRTVDEIASLPPRTIILDRDGAVVRLNPWGDFDPPKWHALDSEGGAYERDFGIDHHEVRLDARLLWHPDWSLS